MVGRAGEFREVIRRALGVDPGSVVTDGKVHRFPTKTGGRDDAGWYIGYADDVPAGAFGDWRSGNGGTWCAKAERDMSPSEREAHRARCAELARQREAERELRHTEAAEKAKRIWAEAEPASTAHPYLAVKRVPSYGIRQSGGAIVVPVRIGGKLASLQFINKAGGKKFLSGGRIDSGYHAIGKPNGAIVVCEGYATGASLYAAIGHAVAVGFYAGNLQAVATSLRERFPNSQIIIAADDDYAIEGNPGVTKAHAAARAVAGTLIIPPFNRVADETGTDWNDYVARHGREATRAAFEAAIAI